MTTNAKNVPAVAGPSTTKKASKAPKKKSKGKQESGSGWTDRLILLLLTFFSAYALWTCPSDEKLVNPVCRSLSQYRTHVLDPYVLPHINNALSHPSVAPVISKIHAAERVVTPVIVRTHAITQPYISRSTRLTKAAAQRTYKTLIRPQYEKYVLPQYTKHVAPHVQQFQDRVVEPYLTPVLVNAHLYTNQAFIHLHRFYTTVQPHVHAAYVRTKPHVQRAWKVAKPYVIRAAESVQALLAVLIDKVGQLRRLYVDPHVLRIWEKVVELSGEVRSTSASAAGITKASSVAPTKTSWSSEAAAVTPSPSSSATLEVETESAVPEETLSPVEPEETAVEIDKQESEVLSASSVIAETLSSFATAESVPAAEGSVEETVEEPVVEEVKEILSASSVIAESISPSEPVESAPVAEESLLEDAVEALEEALEEVPADEDDLDSFFEDLGITPEDLHPPEQVPQVVSQVVIPQQPETKTDLTPEEELQARISAAAEADRAARAARKEQTAEKRVKIEDRLRRWQYGIDELSNRRMRELRKELVWVRKEAVKSLGLTESKKEQEAMKDNEGDEQKEELELEEALTHIDGEPVKDLLDRVEGEGDKLLRGLEGYLKKEEKAESSKSDSEAEDRLKKWMAVSEKVRTRFSEKVREMQEKVHRWYRGVRDLEVQECLAAATEIKAYADQAQADIGLDLAWLDDVTYHDWQKYHDLMRVFHRFEEQMKLVQNGSHPNPPVDPVVPALDKLQVELEDVVGGFDARIRALGVKIREVLFGVTEEESPEDDDADVEPEDEEEQVSILPIDPAPSTPAVPPAPPSEDSKEPEGETEEFDASNVLLGKGKEQVEEALKGVSVEPKASVHEEL